MRSIPDEDRAAFDPGIEGGDVAKLPQSQAGSASGERESRVMVRKQGAGRLVW